MWYTPPDTPLAHPPTAIRRDTQSCRDMCDKCRYESDMCSMFQWYLPRCDMLWYVVICCDMLWYVLWYVWPHLTDTSPHSDTCRYLLIRIWYGARSENIVIWHDMIVIRMDAHVMIWSDTIRYNLIRTDAYVMIRSDTIWYERDTTQIRHDMRMILRASPSLSSSPPPRLRRSPPPEHGHPCAWTWAGHTWGSGGSCSCPPPLASHAWPGTSSRSTWRGRSTAPCSHRARKWIISYHCTSCRITAYRHVALP